MQYFIKDSEGTEHGPVDQETLKKWLEENRIFPDTPIRNSLLGTWRRLEEEPFIKDAAAAQQVRLEQQKDRYKKKIQELKKSKDKIKETADKQTSFVRQLEAVSPALHHRLAALLFDLIPIGVIACIIFFPIAYLSKNHYIPESVLSFAEKIIPTTRQTQKNTVKTELPTKIFEKNSKSVQRTDGKKQMAEAEIEPDIFGTIRTDEKSGQKFICATHSSTTGWWISIRILKSLFTDGLIILFGATLLYYGITLGYYAQTFGMWFWGLFITKPDYSEVFFLRSFVYTVFMLLFGILSPFTVYVFHLTLHEMMAEVRLFKITGKSKI